MRLSDSRNERNELIEAPTQDDLDLLDQENILCIQSNEQVESGDEHESIKVEDEEEDEIDMSHQDEDEIDVSHEDISFLVPCEDFFHEFWKKRHSMSYNRH